jgi:hypothetical protein
VILRCTKKLLAVLVDLRATRRLVTELIERELRREGLPPTMFGDPRLQELILAKTADRSVLECMNEMAFLCEVPSAMLAAWHILTSASLTMRCTATSTALAATG